MNGQQFYWTGTYSFKAEIPMFLKVLKHHIEDLLLKIEKMEKATERN